MSQSLTNQNNAVAVEVQQQTNSEVQLFENSQFGQVRFIKDGDSFWVVGKDVLKALDYPESYRTSRAFTCIPDEWKDVQPMNTPGGTQQMLCLSEQGLYFFLGRSDKPKAKLFKKWIDREVFPVIHSQKHTVPAIPTEISNTNSDIQLFENSQFGQVRFIKNGDSFWVVGKDVLHALEYAEGSIRNASDTFASIPVEWTDTKPICIRSSNGIQQVRNMLCLSEQGLYFFLGRSDKPKAIPYQKWIAGEVVPSIRKTGSYSVNNNQLQLEELTNLVKTVVVQSNQLALENKEIKEQLQELVPKAKFYDAVSETDKTYDMNEVAKTINRCGRNQLFKTLRNKNILMSNNMPYQRYINLGLFKTVLNKNNLYVKTVVTGKGLQFIEDILN